MEFPANNNLDASFESEQHFVEPLIPLEEEKRQSMTLSSKGSFINLPPHENKPDQAGQKAESQVGPGDVLIARHCHYCTEQNIANLKDLLIRAMRKELSN